MFTYYCSNILQLVHHSAQKSQDISDVRTFVRKEVRSVDIAGLSPEKSAASKLSSSSKSINVTIIMFDTLGCL